MMLMFHLRKFRNTVQIALTLVGARTFGKYRHSVTDDDHEYAVYEYRGKVWPFPTKPLEEINAYSLCNECLMDCGGTCCNY